MRIDVLIVRPGMLPKEARIHNKLNSMQEIVDGSIETYRLDQSTICICNETGKLLGMKPCLPVSGDVLVGTVIVCRNVVGDEEFRSLEPEQLQIWKYFLSQPVCRGCMALEDGSLWEELEG